MVHEKSETVVTRILVVDDETALFLSNATAFSIIQHKLECSIYEDFFHRSPPDACSR